MIEQLIDELRLKHAFSEVELIDIVHTMVKYVTITALDSQVEKEALEFYSGPSALYKSETPPMVIKKGGPYSHLELQKRHLVP